MKKSKFTGEQIASALRHAEVGTPIAEVCRTMGVSEATYYRWKQLYGGSGPSELRKMRHLEEENQKLKWLVADQSLDKAMLQEVLAKSMAPDRLREIVHCAVLRFDRKTHRYRSIRSVQAPLRNRIKEIAATRVRYGYRRIHVLLRREGWPVNVKRVHRLYRLEVLNLRAKRPRRHVMAARRVERLLPSHRNEVWAMDFVSDALFNG